MPVLPSDAPMLCLVVLLLGLRHGFDADHLAAIDAMTRLQCRAGRPLARWCGALFSLGHGLVVILLGQAVVWFSRQWQAPAWLDASGSWISITVLLTLGIVNLRSVLATPRDEMVTLVGLRSSWLLRWLPTRNAWAAAALGALFALSFDTLSQAAMFSAAGGAVGGSGLALLLGLCFTLGMLITDALNGWWLARLLARADALAARASRLMGLAVAGVSLLVAALSLARQGSVLLDGWAEHQGLVISLSVIAVLGLSFLVARWRVTVLSRRLHPV